MLTDLISIGLLIIPPFLPEPGFNSAEPRRNAIEVLQLHIEHRLKDEAEIIATRDRLLAEENDPNRIAIIRRNVQRWLDNPELALFEVQNTDDALATLSTLAYFAPKTIQLYGSDVTDQGLRHIATEKQMEYLGLRFCARITDDGIAHLASLPVLNRLDLWHTPITDSSIDHLVRMSQLRALRIAGTNITAVGVRRLQTALPNCLISAD